MTKKLIVDPGKVRRSSVITPKQIPVNTYSRSLKEELTAKGGLSVERCIRIYRDMALIREFETMLDNIKKLGAYQGIEYNHAGPAHLSIGQEGAAVGECVHLGVNDHLFGSHRSHGEIIAKGLRAVEDLTGNALNGIMESYFDGVILNIVQKNEQDCTGLSVSTKGKKKDGLCTGEEEELGVDFLLYGLLAEIFGRETGRIPAGIGRFESFIGALATGSFAAGR